MASIKFNEFKNLANSDINKYTYVDLHLDIEQNQITLNSSTSLKGKDLQMSFDEEAIKNSIVNIFNTIPGERFLIPQFGCNLLNYVFRPVTKSTGEEIGRTILNALRIWEPRVTVDNVFVVGNPDVHEYNITLNISIPTLKKTDVKLVGIITQNGFVTI